MRRNFFTCPTGRFAIMPRNTTFEASELGAERKVQPSLRGRSLRVSASGRIVGRSREVQNVLEMTLTVAYTNSTVLVAEGSVTGRKLVARAICTIRRCKDE